MGKIPFLVGKATDCINLLAITVNSGQVLSKDEASALFALSQQTAKLRNALIQYELKQGASGKEVAKRYGLSQARVSQIKDLVL